LISLGVENLSDKELLAILFRTGRTGKDVLEISQDILQKHKMEKLLQLNYQQLIQIKGIDISKACTLLASFEITKRAMLINENELPIVRSARDAVAHLGNIRSKKRENFVALYLNARNQLIHKEIISIGTLNSSLVHPREVFEVAIRKLTAQIIIAHNHPSGDKSPSNGDNEVTKRIKEAGKILGIELIDHIVLTANDFFSFREEGLMEFS